MVSDNNNYYIFAKHLNFLGEGFTTVLETVETGLGAPTPADLARLTVEERLELNRKADQVKEPWPQSDKDDCDSAAEEGMSEGTVNIYCIYLLQRSECYVCGLGL